MKVKYTIRRRPDGKYEVVINGLVKYVHWDEDMIARWLNSKSPSIPRSHQDARVYIACDKV